MKLNDGQISEIESFVKSKYVEYYDIQVELVDHLASSIEHEMAQNSKLDFKNALSTCYKNFGIFGFSDFVVEREKAVYLQSRKKYWNTFFEFFKVPNIVYSILILILSFLILRNSTHFVMASIIVSVFILAGIFSFYYYFRQKRQQILQLIQREYQPFWISMSGTILNISTFFLGKNLREIIFSNPAIISSFLTILIIGTWAEIMTRQRIFLKLKLDYPDAFKLD